MADFKNSLKYAEIKNDDSEKVKKLKSELAVHLATIKQCMLYGVKKKEKKPMLEYFTDFVNYFQSKSDITNQEIPFENEMDCNEIEDENELENKSLTSSDSLTSCSSMTSIKTVINNYESSTNLSQNYLEAPIAPNDKKEIKIWNMLNMLVGPAIVKLNSVRKSDSKDTISSNSKNLESLSPSPSLKSYFHKPFSSSLDISFVGNEDFLDLGQGDVNFSERIRNQSLIMISFQRRPNYLSMSFASEKSSSLTSIIMELSKEPSNHKELVFEKLFELFKRREETSFFNSNKSNLNGDYFMKHLNEID